MNDTLRRLQAANPKLNMLPIDAPQFLAYGRRLSQFDPAEIIAQARAIMPTSERVVYQPSIKELEGNDFHTAVTQAVYGGMPTQVGWCYGKNLQMDALEYHKGTEVLVCLTDVVLLVGDLRDVSFGGEIHYDTGKVAAFYAPEGSVVELFPWNLHFAPIHTHEGGRFATLVILPLGTNESLPYQPEKAGEARTLFAVNKWLIAHPDAVGLAKAGAYVGMSGPNIVVKPV